MGRQGGTLTASRAGRLRIEEPTTACTTHVLVNAVFSEAIAAARRTFASE